MELGSMLPVELTDEQRKAIEWEPKDTLIISSCPGSGKTLVLVYRVAFWIDQLQIPPKDILLISFTRSACVEVRERLKSLLRTKLVEELRVWTFHSLALSILRTLGDVILKESFGVSRNFTIFSNSEQRKLLERVLAELESGRLQEDNVEKQDWITNKTFSNKQLSNILYQIQKHKARMTIPSNGRLVTIFEKYNQHLRQCNGLDFSDLLLCAKQVLESGRDANSCLAKVWRRYSYAIVDEYQDCSALNKAFLRAILGDNPHVTLIGDDDQSIYGFQGADGGPLTPIFGKEGTETTCSTLNLSINFRSANPIVMCTNSLILKNKYRTKKTVTSGISKRGEIQVWVCRNENCELQALLHNIQNLTVDGVYSKIAVLTRTRSAAFEVFSYLKNHNIPCKLSSEASQSSGDDYEILPRNGQDLCILIVKNFCKLMLNTKDDVALLLLTAIYFPNVPQHLLSQWKNSDSSSLLQELRDVCRKSLKGSNKLYLQDKSKQFLMEEYSEEINQLLYLIDTITGKFLKNTRLSILCEEIVDLLPLEMRRRIGDRDLFISKQIFQKAEMALEQQVDCSIMQQQQPKEEHNQSVKNALFSLSKNRNKDFTRSDSVYTRLKIFVDSLEQVQSEYEIQIQKKNCVQCCTVHQAKGKEWNYVHVVRFNEDFFPLQTTYIGREMEIHYEEERRLAYVALSRARIGLFLSYLEEEEGGRKPLIPSRFLTEFSDSLTKRKRIDFVDDTPARKEDGTSQKRKPSSVTPQKKRKK